LDDKKRKRSKARARARGRTTGLTSEKLLHSKETNSSSFSLTLTKTNFDSLLSLSQVLENNKQATIGRRENIISSWEEERGLHY
jgi:hypothetical protein